MSDVRPLSAGALNTLLRACLVAKPGHTLIVCDFSQVEARDLACAAGDEVALETFAKFDAGDKVNGDPYRVMAARIFGKRPDQIPKESTERKIGKIAELALGYGQGAGGSMHAATGKPYGFHGFAEANGADWIELGKPPLRLTAAAVVKSWRELHAPIVDFWHAMERAAIRAVEDGPGAVHEAGPFAYHNVDGLVVLALPSGRVLAYRGLVVTRDERGRKRLRYQSRKGFEDTYGGKLVENAIQADCRDFMAHALTEAEYYGLAPVLTIHDEIVCEVPSDQSDSALGLLTDIMTTPPPWRRAMPLAAAGHICKPVGGVSRYHK